MEYLLFAILINNNMSISTMGWQHKTQEECNVSRDDFIVDNKRPDEQKEWHLLSAQCIYKRII